MAPKITEIFTELTPSRNFSIQRATYATTISTVVNSPTHSISFPSSQPPSHKPPEFRKSQLLRQYASLLRSSPLIVLFQHNNIKAKEWLALRRELSLAFRNVDKTRRAAVAEGSNTQYQDLAECTKITIVQTGIFAAALRVVEYYKPQLNTPSVSPVRNSSQQFTHALSKYANRMASKNMSSHELSSLFSGPICILSFPSVSPLHLKEAISILSPSPPDFPAPKRKTNPGWHDPAVQEAIKKLILLGARVERRAFDIEGTKMLGGMGGMEVLQGQLVAMLSSMGASLTGTLESAARNLYFTLENRRSQLENDFRK